MATLIMIMTEHHHISATKKFGKRGPRILTIVITYSKIVKCVYSWTLFECSPFERIKMRRRLMEEWQNFCGELCRSCSHMLWLERSIRQANKPSRNARHRRMSGKVLILDRRAKLARNKGPQISPNHPFFQTTTSHTATKSCLTFTKKLKLTADLSLSLLISSNQDDRTVRPPSHDALRTKRRLGC